MKSIELFRDGLNCAQAVFVPYAAGYFQDTKFAIKVMAPFGAGISDTNNMCGAVTGGIASIGIRLGQTSRDDTEARARCGKATRQFISEFKKLHGNINCTPLIGYNLGIPEEREKATESGKFGTVCTKLVDSASNLVEKILSEHEKANE